MRRASLRPAALLAALCALAAGVPARAGGSRARVPSSVPIVWDTDDRIYAAWSEAEGARVGARALLRRPGDPAFVDTLQVAWVQDDIAAFEWGPVGSGVFAPGRLAADHAVLTPVAWAPAPPSGSLCVPIGALPRTLDPARITTLAEKQVGVQIFDGLVRADARVGTLPDAATDAFAVHGQTYRFRLRPDERFHDGRPVRATDVVASLERSLAPATNAPRIEPLLEAVDGARAYHEGRAATIRGVRAPDSTSVEVDAAYPGARVLDALATPPAWIVPADAAAAPGFAFLPVGSGPFRFVASDTAGVTLVAAPGRDGGVDTLRFRLTHGPEDAALQFELGRIDVVSPPEADVGRLIAEGSAARAGDGPPVPLTLHERSTYYLGMNTRAPWLEDRAHRRALAAAIDRDLAVRVLVAKRGILAYGLLPMEFAVNAVPDSAWRPAPAEAALLPRLAPPSAGLSFWVPAGSDAGTRFAEFVQASLARHGVRVRIVTRPWPEFERAVDSGQADLFYLSWYADGPDPVAYVRSMVGSASRGAGGNRTWYANAEVDSLLDVARRAAGPPARDSALVRAETIALSDAPLVPLFHSVNVTLVRSGVRGFELDPFGCPRYDAVEVRRGQ